MFRRGGGGGTLKFSTYLGLKRELIVLLSLSSWCLVIAVWLFLKMPWVCLQFVSIQLMHSFEVYIRICQPENSDVHRGKAEVNHFRGLTNPDVNRKRMHQLFCYMTLSLFS